MFFSHQHSLHHNPGSLPSTLLTSDPTKAHPVSLPSKLHSANQRTTSALSTQHSSSKFLPTPASIRAGIGSKASAQQQAHQTSSSTTTATAFASRNTTFHPSGGGGPAAANQSRFAATLNAGTPYRTAPGGSHLGTSVPIPPVANTGGIGTGATFTKNTPAVKFLFKKPQLPATLSSSAALYHFSNHSPTSGQTNGAATSSNSSAGTSLSKFSIPKLSSSAPNGDVASCPTSGKPFSSNGSPLDQQARPTHYSHHATNGRPNGGGAFTSSTQHVSPSLGQQQQQPPSGTLSSHQLALLKYQQHQLTYVRLSCQALVECRA